MGTVSSSGGGVAFVGDSLLGGVAEYPLEILDWGILPGSESVWAGSGGVTGGFSGGGMVLSAS